MWRFFISIALLICSLSVAAQEVDATLVATDSLKFKKPYGLRVGIDAASLIRTAVDEEYTGIQLLGDFRLTDDWYAAAELGNERLDRQRERVGYEASGSFIKAGVDYNMYDNWLDMDNMIYVGARLGYSNFSQTLKAFQVNNDNNYFAPQPVFSRRESSGLSAFWIELQAGIKVEVLKNIFMVGNVQIKRLFADIQPDGFDNLFVPGFGRTYDNSSVGVGYVYGITYRLPLYRK